MSERNESDAVRIAVAKQKYIDEHVKRLSVFNDFPRLEAGVNELGRAAAQLEQAGGDVEQTISDMVDSYTRCPRPVDFRAEIATVKAKEVRAPTARPLCDRCLDMGWYEPVWGKGVARCPCRKGS